MSREVNYKLEDMNNSQRCWSCGESYKNKSGRGVRIRSRTICKECIEYLYMASIEDLSDLSRVVGVMDEPS